MVEESWTGYNFCPLLVGGKSREEKTIIVTVTIFNKQETEKIDLRILSEIRK